MKAGLIALIVVAVLVLGLGGCGVSTYNGLVQQGEAVTSAWSQVQNQYQRRMDLIPNLVETVKGVANFEKETYTAVAEARANAGKVQLTPETLANPQAFANFEKAQGELGSALSRLLVTVERYPELKANTNFSQLQDELAGTENRISVERKRFNDTVQGYNVAVKRFPTVIFARLLGFNERPYFQSQAGAEQAPQVKF